MRAAGPDRSEVERCKERAEHQVGRRGPPAPAGRVLLVGGPSRSVGPRVDTCLAPGS